MYERLAAFIPAAKKDTLYDTVEGITRCVRYALRKRGLDAPLESLRCFAGPPLDDMFVEKFGLTREDAEQAVRDFRERYVPIGLYESRPFPGMKDLLRELKAAGYQLAVTTSKPQVLAEELLRRGELYELFDCICGAADQGEGNAKWQVLRRAMERLRAPEEESLHASVWAMATQPGENWKMPGQTLSPRIWPPFGRCFSLKNRLPSDGQITMRCFAR